MPRASKREGRTCQVCVREFFRRANSDGSFEPPVVFFRRQFCSRTCSAISRERKKKLARDAAWFTRALEEP
jgi:hypothetical protein